MKKLFQLYKRYEMIINYLFIGGLTTLINFVTFFAMRYFGIGLVLTNTTANIVSVIFAFFANKSVVFHSDYSSKKKFWFELISFLVLRGVSLLLDNLIMIIGVDWLHGNEILLKILDQVIIVIANYLFSKLIFLRKK
ncbi:GtrA family protein [Lacticaseibacillus paracasei]|uniref:GtrA family protein n=1 Tax=Lacticaseibacillus paracasei TaxID=1597 RepID=UPI00156E6DFB|nr:GtrA family protein [Lacticaseibacillus paracasei]QKK93939.1 GtrA family protein [Lacticaseibacillus paracasei]